MGFKNGDIFWIFLLFSLAFLVGEISALFFKKIADLGVKGNVRSSKVNVDLLGYKFEAVAETPVGEDIKECDAYYIFKMAYLSRNENIAVIIVDWPEISDFLYYKEAATNVKLVAKILANFLESYIDDGVIDILKVHVIGFSLGAQVAGFIGKYLRRDLRLPRITGLDPAYPGYDDVSEDQRINPRDAEFVDIIHTDGGRIGFNNSIGHLDFFPNGGTYYQPGCEYNIYDDSGTGMKFRQKPKGKCSNCCPSSLQSIQLKLFSRTRPERPFYLPHVRKKTALYRSLNNSTNVIIYIHGFMEITEAGAAYNLKNAYLKRDENYAIILVDWSELVSFPYYFEAIMNVKPVAKILAKFLESYIDDGVIDIEKVHVIGFSLGAQVAGFLGKYLRGDLRLPRITGLDPAYPGYNTASEDQRINSEDAIFVDIIHTDGGSFGFINPIGQLDFYPNGGTYYQPGCSHSYLRKENRIFELASCSHNSAHKFYIESIKSPYNFPAIKCYLPSNGGERRCNESDIVYMGFAANFKARGSYFLKTNISPPYGKGSNDVNSQS